MKCCSFPWCLLMFSLHAIHPHPVLKKNKNKKTFFYIFSLMKMKMKNALLHLRFINIAFNSSAYNYVTLLFIYHFFIPLHSCFTIMLNCSFWVFFVLHFALHFHYIGVTLTLHNPLVYPNQYRLLIIF